MNGCQKVQRRPRRRQGAEAVAARIATSIAVAALAVGATVAGASSATAAPARGSFAAALAIPEATTVAAGGWHTCSIKTDGSLWCWGSNYDGQLGDGTRTTRTTPERIGAVNDWAAIAAGNSHTCGVQTDGSLWCWGYNFRGQLGDGTTTVRDSPVRIGESTDWASVAAGDSHTCAVRTDGTLWCWGFNRLGQLGVGVSVWIQTEPLQVGEDSDWASVTAGFAHTCGVRADGSLWCWGDSSTGQAGLGPDVGYSTTPAQVGIESTWKGVSAGHTFTCGIQTNASLWCWGDNGYGQLGMRGRYTTAPSQVGADWSAVHTSYNSACALRIDDTLWCWGENSYGQVGDGTNVHRFGPTQVGDDSTWAGTFGGGYHFCASRADDSVWCWGHNGAAQLGDGGTDSRNTPAEASFAG